MKTLDKAELNIINKLISSKDWLRLTSEIQFEADAKLYSGKIEIGTPKGNLQLNVLVSKNFPLGKIEFICTSHKGYPHEMPSGLLCLMAAPASSLADRLELELEKLLLWVNKYFIAEEQDSHFEYYQFGEVSSIDLIFEEDSIKEKINDTYGTYTFGFLNVYSIADKLINATFLAYDLGGRKCRWSEAFIKQCVKGNYRGIWLKINSHPITTRRHRIENWVDLIGLLSPAQTKFLNDEARHLRQHSFIKDNFYLCIGYEIAGPLDNEIHWDLITVPFDDFPYKGKKNETGRFEPEDKGQKVAWAKTINGSYTRLFGRGKLADSLTNTKILIIGTGAIGSSLFLSLIRGGCKQVDITDFDLVDPGNICRGQFSFTQSGKSKVSILQEEALSISPFIETTSNFGISPLTKGNPNYPNELDKLNKYNYIFDCSTDKYLSIMLDSMEINGKIINLSISNEAREMVIIIGKGNIHIAKSQLYNRVSPGKQEPFFVATGCWHPTFKASFSDINVLLHYAVNEINHRLENNLSIASFYISKRYSETNSLTYEISYRI